MMSLQFIVANVQQATNSEPHNAIQGFFQDSFVKSIIIPLVLTIASTGMEYLSALPKGKASKDRIYRVWIPETNSSSSSNLTSSSTTSATLSSAVINPPDLQHFTPRAIDFLHSRSDFTHVETLITKEFSDFGSVAINLIIGAFAVDITSLLDANNTSTITGVVILVHLLFLIAILGCLLLNNMTEPINTAEKNRYVKLAILFGLIAMTIAFFVISPTPKTPI
jgi:hypothetical protein